MSTRLRQRRLQGFNNVAAGFMPAINAPVKSVPASSRRRATSCFLLPRIYSHGCWNTTAIHKLSHRAIIVERCPIKRYSEE